ncbi:MAG: filamentous hemagglutinin N-terminal domain-containing protein, partial [Candidatus Omnitrophica bacterium]|nr:filamentous hemagglutinin N-terminal domain-containing protein [Candidatus Omnitrophota bacterium]
MTSRLMLKVAAIVMAVTFGLSEFVFAMPAGWSVQDGEATFEIDSDGALNITASDKAIIEFQSFSIGEDEAVRFLQSSSEDSVLARVTGGLESLIYGDLFATGNLILVNTSGIHVFDTANIQAQSFLASTLDIENAMYREGQYVFEQTGDIAGFINNEGSITVQPGGFAALLAGGVSNSGEIIADKGEVIIASGEKMTLTFGNTGINLIVDESMQNRVNEAPIFSNTGLIQSNDGRINISASLLNQTLDTLINNEG